MGDEEADEEPIVELIDLNGVLSAQNKSMEDTQ